jgi:hypothetical protein
MADDLNSQPSSPQTSRAMLDLEAVLTLPQGRRFVMSILERAGLYRSSYTGDEAATNHRLGEQNIALWLLAQMEQLSPTTYPQLLLDVARDKDKETVHVLDDGK